LDAVNISCCESRVYFASDNGYVIDVANFIKFVVFILSRIVVDNDDMVVKIWVCFGNQIMYAADSEVTRVVVDRDDGNIMRHVLSLLL
jgi:hypothetical protein